MIKEIKEDLEEAINLVWRVFLEFEAPNYTQEGIDEFKNSIFNKEWVSKKKFYGYYNNGDLLGVIATNNINHISLLFVDGNYHMYQLLIYFSYKYHFCNYIFYLIL